MHVVVAEVVDKKVNKVVEEVNKELVMDVVVEGVVDKEVTKVVEEVNKKLVKEVNDGLVLVWKCGDGRRGDHEVDCGHRDDVVLDMEADVEDNQEVDKEVDEEVDEFSHVGRVWRSTWSLHNGERPSACELCANTFSSGNNLKMHMKAHVR